MKAKLGIFTPYAKVICFKCHGSEFPNKELSNEAMEDMDNPVALKKGNHFTRCDSCGSFVQLNKSVAQEHNIALELTELGYESELHQTGGMNSACSISINIPQITEDEEQPYYYMTYNFEGDDAYVIYGYNADGSTIEDSGYQCESYEKMLKHILNISNLKKI